MEGKFPLPDTVFGFLDWTLLQRLNNEQALAVCGGQECPHYTHSACLAIDFCLWTWIEDTLELAGGITSWHRHLRRSMHYGNLLNKKSSSAIISIRGSLNSLSQMARESKEGNIFKSWKDWPFPFVLLCQKSFICPFIPNQYNCFCSKPGPGFLAVEAK